MTSPRKVALVTGAAAGIGAAICKRLARDGIAIGALDLSLADVQKTADAVTAAGGQAIALQASIADRTQVQAACDTLRAEYGPINILVNNAGISRMSPFEELTDAQWDEMMAVNLKGPFIVTQTVIGDMKAQGWGRIVNLSSSSAQTGAANMTHYASSKGAIMAFTKSLAQEYGPLGITANDIPPRSVQNTAMSSVAMARPDMVERFEAMRLAGPIMRHGEPEDVAGACAWLVSDEAGYITGQTIGVNGGKYIN